MNNYKTYTPSTIEDLQRICESATKYGRDTLYCLELLETCNGTSKSKHVYLTNKKGAGEEFLKICEHPELHFPAESPKYEVLGIFFYAKIAELNFSLTKEGNFRMNNSGDGIVPYNKELYGAWKEEFSTIHPLAIKKRDEFLSGMTIPKDEIEIIKDYNRDHKDRMHIYQMEHNDGRLTRFALDTSEVKEERREYRYGYVSVEEWARLAVQNYMDIRMKNSQKRGTMTQFEFELTVCKTKTGTAVFSLLTAKDERWIINAIKGGRLVSMEKKVVGVSEWLKHTFASYYQEEMSWPNPNDDALYNITLDELQEYEDTLTDDEKHGNY